MQESLIQRNISLSVSDVLYLPEPSEQRKADRQDVRNEPTRSAVGA